MTDFLTSALRGKPYWGYVTGGRAYHARREEGDRVAVCGVEPRPNARWRGSYRIWITTIQNIDLPKRPECSRCHRVLHPGRTY